MSDAHPGDPRFRAVREVFDQRVNRPWWYGLKPSNWFRPSATEQALRRAVGMIASTSYHAETFESLDGRLTHWLTARSHKDPQFAEVLDLYQWGKRIHTGKRDNGEPEYIHQVRMCLKLAKIVDRMDEARQTFPDMQVMFKALICHDMLEDGKRDPDTGAFILRAYLQAKIGPEAEDTVYRMSRKYFVATENTDESGNQVLRKIRKEKEQEHADLLGSPRSLFGKLLDRSDNIDSMASFDLETQPREVIYKPEKAQEKIREAINVYLQEAAPHKASVSYADSWQAPLQLASKDLITSIKKALSGVIGFFVDGEILRPDTYGVTHLLSALTFPPQSRPEELRPSKATGGGAEAIDEPIVLVARSDGHGFVPTNQAPGAVPLRPMGGSAAQMS